MSAPEPAGVDLGSLSGLPLPADVQALLGSLRPPPHPRFGRAEDTLPAPSSAVFHRHEPTEVHQRLGFAVPGLSVLRAEGQVELLTTFGYTEPAAPRELNPGDRRLVTLLYLPDEAVLELAPRELLAHGVTLMEVHYGNYQPLGRARTNRSPGMGDSTVVEVRGHHVGVWHQRPGVSRLEWEQPLGGVECCLLVYTPRPPLPAVEMLLECDVLT